MNQREYKEGIKVEFPMFHCKNCGCVFNIRNASSIEEEVEIETVNEDIGETHQIWNDNIVRIECPICGYLHEIRSSSQIRRR